MGIDQVLQNLRSIRYTITNDNISQSHILKIVFLPYFKQAFPY